MTTDKYVPRLILGNNDNYGYITFAIHVVRCKTCRNFMLPQELNYSQNNPLDPLALVNQMRERGVVFPYMGKDACGYGECVNCYEKRTAFICAICGQQRRISDLEYHVGDCENFKCLCSKCYRTTSAQKWNWIIKDIQKKLGVEEFEDD